MGQGPGPKRTPLNQAAPSLLPRGLKEKLMVAFSLMSIVPLLVLGYIVTNYVFPRLETFWDISLVVVLAVVIAFLGMAVARGLVLPVIKLASQAQAIAQGNLDREVEVGGPDEVGSLGVALNQITQRVRDNMSQLSVYGEQTKQLNLDINRRILTLSHLLQVSSLIGQSAKIEEVTTFILEKLTQIEEAELNCLLEFDAEEGSFTVRGCVGVDANPAQALLGERISSPWLGKVLQERRVVVVDHEHKPDPDARELLESRFGMANAVLQPVVSMRRGIAVLLSAHRKPGFVFKEECLDLLKVFGKQMAIAVENDLLNKRAEELKVIDELTGLYNAGYMKSRLEEELRRAMRYHRPCSLILLSVDGFQQLQDLYGVLVGEGVLHQLAELLKGQVSEVDRIGRMDQEEFALILPERNKREAIELAESIRRAIEACRFTNGPQPLSRNVTVCAGISENPLDGSTCDELLAKAAEAMKRARTQGRNKVVAS